MLSYSGINFTYTRVLYSVHPRGSVWGNNLIRGNYSRFTEIFHSPPLYKDALAYHL